MTKRLVLNTTYVHTFIHMNNIWFQNVNKYCRHTNIRLCVALLCLAKLGQRIGFSIQEIENNSNKTMNLFKRK